VIWRYLPPQVGQILATCWWWVDLVHFSASLWQHRCRKWYLPWVVHPWMENWRKTWPAVYRFEGDEIVWQRLSYSLVKGLLPAGVSYHWDHRQTKCFETFVHESMYFVTVSEDERWIGATKVTDIGSINLYGSVVETFPMESHTGDINDCTAVGAFVKKNGACGVLMRVSPPIGKTLMALQKSMMEHLPYTSGLNPASYV
jgi:hypothetical protein